MIWTPLEAYALTEFPRLTLDELRFLTLSSYQIKQATSYTQDHLTEGGLHQLFVFKESRDVLRVQIQSGHTSSKVHNLWIQFTDGLNPITGWYCQCKSGATIERLAVVLTLHLCFGTWITIATVTNQCRDLPMNIRIMFKILQQIGLNQTAMQSQRWRHNVLHPLPKHFCYLNVTNL